MSCLLALLAVITPRIAIMMIWLFSDWLGRAYDSAIWPVLGHAMYVPEVRANGTEVRVTVVD